MISSTQTERLVSNQMKRTEELPKSHGPAIRIVLIDDNQLLRTGMKTLISERDGVVIVGEAEDKGHAIDLVRRMRPDVMLLNAEMQYGDGLEMIPDLRAACETARIAVLTNSKDPEIHRQAMLNGAIGVIYQSDPPALLLHAIRRVHAGGVWLDRFVAAKMLGTLSGGNRRQDASPDEKKISTLTNREREVIKLVGEGLKNKQIAEQLFISDVTVHHHLTSIYSKLEVKDRLELIVYAYRNRLAEVPR